MKRKLFAATLLLALLVSAYTAYACWSTRGLRVYLMGTKMGAILAGSWQITLLAAVALWIPGIVILIRKATNLRRKPSAFPQAAEPTEILQEDTGTTERLEPRKGSIDVAASQNSGKKKTVPLFGAKRAKQSGKAGTSGIDTAEPTELLDHDVEATELLEPRRGSDDATELLEPRRGSGDATELLEPRQESELVQSDAPPSHTDKVEAAENSPAAQEPPKTEKLPEMEMPPKAAETPGAEPSLREESPAVVMPTAGQSPQKEPLSAAPVPEKAPRFCSKCGHPVTGNFCAKCGTKVNR